MKRQQNNLCLKDLSKIGKTDTRSSSDYSTCSDDFRKSSDDEVRESTILSGQIRCENTLVDIALRESLKSETTIDSEISYPINILDQNIDVIAEDDDVFLDCNNTSQSSTDDSSTVYLPIARTSELSEIRSANNFYDKYVQLNNLEVSAAMNEGQNDLQTQTENKHLTTILEETKISCTTKSFRKKSSEKIANTTGEMVAEVINKIKECENLNKNSTKRVLFVNEDKDTENVHYTSENSILKSQEKSPHLLRRKVQCCSGEKGIDENCNVHNTTESFVLWERFCKTSETSQSCFSEYYGGDDEFSTTYKTIDDTFISNCSIDLSEKTELKTKLNRRRSKSCDSILREVRHLPHVIFDKFLKCMGEEIENIRKRNIVCTCKKSSKKNLLKENEKIKLKTTPIIPVLQVQNLTTRTNDTRNERVQPQRSPHKISNVQSRLFPQSLTNNSENISRIQKSHKSNIQSRLSPESLTNNSENISKIQKSPRTPTNSSQKRGFYSLQKEIVSPVGEYIRGKRASPFKNSPSKKKV